MRSVPGFTFRVQSPWHNCTCTIISGAWVRHRACHPPHSVWQDGPWGYRNELCPLGCYLKYYIQGGMRGFIRGGACIGFIRGVRGFIRGGMHGFICGACMVLFWGSMCVLFGGACVVLFGGMRGFIWGGVHGFIRGACVVLFGGRAWFFQFFRIQWDTCQWAGGTHPTGMHSCLIHVLAYAQALVGLWVHRHSTEWVMLIGCYLKYYIA